MLLNRFSQRLVMISIFVLVSCLMVAASSTVQAKPAWWGTSSDAGGSDGGGGKGKKAKTTTVSIVSSPESIDVETGAYAAFSVVAETNDGSNVTYVWYRNDQEILGATSDFYSVEQASAADAGSYLVVVAARGVEQSAVATLTLVEPELPVFYPIEISLQPLSFDAYVNESVTLNVSAMSETPMQFQWRKDGQDILDATQAHYALQNVSAQDSAQYDVVITNGSDFVVSQSAVLQVDSLPGLSLNWDLPSERVDGTYLAAEEISGFSLYMAQDDSFAEQKLTIVGAVTSHGMEALTRGRHYFSIATIDDSGMEGPRSEAIIFDVN
jgi:hypothetical protein